MKGRYAVSLLGLTAMLVHAGAHSARAEDGPCTRLRIEAQPSVQARWPELTERLHEAFDVRGDIDRCSFVLLSRRAATIEVRVILPDGRSAVRSVARPDVLAAFEALLVLPELRSTRGAGVEASTAATWSVPPPTAAPSTRTASVEASATAQQPGLLTTQLSPLEQRERPVAIRPRRAQPGASPQAEQSGMGFEVSVITAARIGDQQWNLGLGVVSVLDLATWLIGFEARVDGYQQLAGDASMPVVTLALLGGRRLRFGSFALDLAAGPALAMLGGMDSTVMPADGSRPRWTETTGSGFVPRLRLAARVHFSMRSVIRTFVGADAEFGASGARERPLSNSPAQSLPVWSVGLALGATAGTL